MTLLAPLGLNPGRISELELAAIAFPAINKTNNNSYRGFTLFSKL
jgi:hypothetical protein